MQAQSAVPPREALTIRGSDHRPRAFVERVRERVRREDLDALVAVTGPEGIGKSTAAWVLASNIDPTFSPDRVGWDGNAFVGIAKAAKPGRVVMLDEAVEGMNNRQAMSQANKDLTSFLYVCRERNLAMLVAFPRFDSLDLVIREHRAWAWVRVIDRGKAEIRIRNPNESVGRTEQDALEAFDLVARWTFDAVSGADWERYKAKKTTYVQAMADQITDG